MSEQCSRCGRYVGLWNLRFDREIVCTLCMMPYKDDAHPPEDVTAAPAPAPRLKKKRPRRPRVRTTLSTA
jgi:hypothetical protein